ncbi:MAG: hypothetical protein IIZ78_25105 [Clostridiales bacterium]|nr:hypothetical protein [Clostridiales bacterium]
MMDIGSICLCLTVGALIVFASIGIGVCFGRCDKEQHDTDDDVIIYIPLRDRNRRGNKRDSPPDAREIVDVLYMLRIAASSREKKVIDYLIDREEKE